MWGTDPVKSKQECLIIYNYLFAILSSLTIFNHIKLFICTAQARIYI